VRRSVALTRHRALLRREDSRALSGQERRKRSEKNLMPCDERESGGGDKMELGPDGIKTPNMLAIAFRSILILNAELSKMPAVALKRFKISKLISYYRR